MRRSDTLRSAALRAAMACILTLGVAACGQAERSGSASAPPSSSAPSASEPVTSASPAPTGPGTVGLEELGPLSLSMDGGPDWPTGLDGSVWILAPDGPEPLVHRLDPQTGEEQAAVNIGPQVCEGLTAGFGSLWACIASGVARIDPETNEVVAEITFPTAQVYGRAAISEDAVWMLSGNVVVADSVVKIDPETNAVVATYPLGHSAAALAFGGGALWATATDDGMLLRLDPATGAVEVHARDLPAPAAISFGAGSIWVGLYGEHGGPRAAAGEPAIARISARDGSVQAMVDIASNSTVEGDLWASDAAVWVRSPNDPFLLRIDPATDEVGFAVAGFQSGGTVAVIDGAVWATSIEFGTVWRLDL